MVERVDNLNILSNKSAIRGLKEIRDDGKKGPDDVSWTGKASLKRWHFNSR